MNFSSLGGNIYNDTSSNVHISEMETTAHSWGIKFHSSKVIGQFEKRSGSKTSVEWIMVKDDEILLISEK